jgi:hypothetical protein
MRVSKFVVCCCVRAPRAPRHRIIVSKAPPSPSPSFLFRLLFVFILLRRVQVGHSSVAPPPIVIITIVVSRESTSA